MTEKFPRISIENIEQLGISSKKEVTQTEVRHLTKISFIADAEMGEVARLMYLHKRGKPINVTFECPQAEFDLNVSAVKLSSGEIVPEQAAGRL